MTVDNLALLRAREEELSAIYETVPGILFYIAIEPDGEFRFVSVSRDFVVATGLAREQILGSLVRDVIPPPSREMVLNYYRQAIRSGQTMRWEEASVYPAGWRYGEVAVTPLYDASGVATHLIGIVHDLTKRKRLEESLRESEERLRRAMSNGTIGVWDWDLSSGRLKVSPEVGRIYGVDVTNLRSYEDIAALVHPDDLAAAESERDAAIRNHQPFDTAFRIVLPSGEIRWIAVRGQGYYDENGRVVRVVGNNVDITERKQAEEALREREQRLRFALDASGAGSWMRDAVTGRVDWDDRFRKLYGFTSEEPASFDTWLSRVHEEDRRQVLDSVNQKIRTKTRDAFDNTFRIVRPDGSVAWLQSLGQAHRDAEGQLIRLTGLVLDITARKRDEANFAFCTDVTAEISQLSTVDEIMQAFGARIGEFLKVSSVSYWDIDDGRNEARLHSIWAAPHASELPPFVRLTDYYSSDAFARAMRAGETTVICDTELDPRVDSTACRAIQLRALIVVPFSHEGKWRFALNLFDSNPHDWREDEIELVEELAHRIFPRLERARVEEALRESEERYRGLAEQVADGIFATDSQGRYVDANRAGCEMFGYTLEELKTLTVRDVIPLDELQRLPEQFQRLSSGQVVRNDWRFRRKDGSVFIGELVCSQSSDGRLRGIVRDITERKKAELAVRASEQQLQSYLDHAGDGIYVLDSESGRILNANNRALQMLGYSRDELLKLSAVDIEAGHSQVSVQAHHQRTLKEVVAVEGIHRRKDGSTFPVEIRLTSLAPAQPHLVLALVRDITERKAAEAALRDEARRKDEFLAVLGHELRNPLAAISISLQVLSAGVTADPRARMEAIGRQVTLMRRLLDDLLDLGRIKYGHIELMQERIDLAEFLQKATSSLRSAIANRRQELILRIPSESVQFMADRIRLEQIATNLLSNASKYTGPEGRIELSGAREGSEIVLHCKDNGQGVLPEDQEKIFQPFTRGCKTQDSHGEASLGIGLTLAKQLTELHGGTISVESAGADRGSDFIVRLPLVTPPSDKPVTAEPPQALPSHRGRTIVLVEDNPDIAEGMEIALERVGHSVRMFPDGPSALAGVAELKPDAVLVDVGLPGMDGYELAVELKKQTNMRDALFIALSGFEPRKQGGPTVGDFDHYFTKPVDLQALLALFDTNGKRQKAK